ncbi:serine-type endopeptidase inhibitor [Perilla frutescens var. frutescens]|nr:serine-type endopeptidase inhibitor [Perilla frutescens var. frutescens]
MAAKHTARLCSWALLIAMVLVVSNVECARPKLCLLYCLVNPGNYMTCPSSGDEKLRPACNCCLAQSDGCNIYSANGTSVCPAT